MVAAGWKLPCGMTSPSAPTDRRVKFPFFLGIRWGPTWEKEISVRSRKGCDSPGECLWNALPPWGALPILWLSRKLLEPEAHLESQYHPRQWRGWRGGIFSLARELSLHLWEAALVSPEKSSTQQHKEFLWDEEASVMSPVMAFL